MNVLILLAVALIGVVGREASAADARADFEPSIPYVAGRPAPPLTELRARAADLKAEEQGPVPGGLGAGTIYLQGKLPTRRGAELETAMIVHPDGIAAPDWIYTTATNRTEKTVEVVGAYLGDGANLGIFDWSCTPQDPCGNGETGPSWQWGKDFNKLPCYVAPMDDGGGHTHEFLRYRNRSLRLGRGDAPPAPVPNWSNSVFLWNYCTVDWDLVYSHRFRADQHDCTLEQYGCAWWGPIIETFFEGLPPPIKELGFVASSLRYDGGRSFLMPDDTYFSPPLAPWIVLHLVPNGSWGVGSD